MSMLEADTNIQKTKEKYKRIISYGNKLGYQTFIDVSPRLFKKLVST